MQTRLFLLSSLIFLMLFLPAIIFGDVDTTATIESFGHFGQFHTLDYVGDYEAILEYLDTIITGYGRNQFFCSLFTATADLDRLLMGRNFDNPYQDVLVARYNPPDGYANIAINRLADLGLPVGADFGNLNYAQKLLLLRAPYFAADGINERGLTAGLAYTPPVTYEVDTAKDSIWITRLTREILDHAQTIEEAAAIANSYNVYDEHIGIVSHHLLIAEASGASAILEFANGAFQIIPATNDWQVLTNSTMYNVPHSYLMNICWRYATLYNHLEFVDGDIDWQQGMHFLDLVHGNQSTQWSAMYDINNQGIYLSVYSDFENIAYIDLPNFDVCNYGYFSLVDTVWQDADGNQEFEAGDTITIVTTIGSEFNAYGVSGHLSTEHSFIQIVDGDTNFGDIDHDSLASHADDPFQIIINADAPCQQAELQLALSTNYGYQFTLPLSFTIGGVPAENAPLTAKWVASLSNYPNPFNPQTTISFTMPQAGRIELIVYNIKGQRVKTLVDDDYESGQHAVVWDGVNNHEQAVASGVYLLQLQVDGENQAVKKIMLMK